MRNQKLPLGRAGYRGLGLTVALWVLAAVGAGALNPFAVPTVEVPEASREAADLWTTFGVALQAELDGEYERALEGYREVERRVPATAEVLTRKAACLYRLHEYQKAARHARQAIELDSLEVEAYRTLAESRIHMGRLQGAVEPLRRAIQIRSDPLSLQLLVNVLLHLGREEDALEPLDALVERHPEAFRERRAKLRARLGQFDGALEDFWAVLEGNPRRTDVAEDLAELLEQLDRPAQLERLYRMQSEAFPRQREVRWNLVRLLIQTEQWEQVETEVEALRVLGPTDPLPLLQLGLIAYRRGDAPRALEWFDQAWALSPQDPRILRWRMRLRLATGSIDSALVSARRLIIVRPEDLEAWKTQAVGLVEVGHWEEALISLEHWGGLDEQDPEPWVLAASIHRQAERWQPALTAMRQALARDSESAELVLEYAALLEAMDRFEEAEEALRPLLQSETPHPEALNFLGYALVVRGDRLQEAEQMITAALATQPRNPAFLDSMGWLWYKKGHLEKAQEWLEKSVAEGGRHPEIYSHLAEVLLARGQSGDAERTLRLGLAWNPEDASLRQMLQRVESP